MYVIVKDSSYTNFLEGLVERKFKIHVRDFEPFEIVKKKNTESHCQFTFIYTL